MHSGTYLFVAIIFIVLCLMTYYINRRSTRPLIDVYTDQLLKRTDPAIAFTYQQLGPTTYENYYLDTESEEDTLKLVSEIQEYPVWPDGIRYNPPPHGDITELDDKTGFRIDGVATNFTCPENWIWDTLTKTCHVDSICKLPEDVGYLRGIDQYHFNSMMNNNNEDEVIRYHPRVYVQCTASGYDTQVCPDNKLYNQLEIQAGTIDPCVEYDICSDRRDYYKHQNKISPDDVLAAGEYYMCLSGKSVKQKCEPPLVFNQALLACNEEGPCHGKPDGFTFPDGDSKSSYNTCVDEIAHKVHCGLYGIYTNPTSHMISCTVDTSKTYMEWFNTEYLFYPTGCYKYVDNVQSIVRSSGTLQTLSRKLLPDISSPDLYTPTGKRTTDVLYADIPYVDQYVQSVSLEEVAILDTTLDYLADHLVTNYTLASYNTNALPDMPWSYIEDRPRLEDETVYYTREGNIYHIDDSEIPFAKASDYPPFDRIVKLQGIRPEFITHTDTDETYNINLGYNLLIPTNNLYSYRIAFAETLNIDNGQMTIINHVTNTIDTILWDKTMIVNPLRVNPPQCMYYNLQEPVIEPEKIGLVLQVSNINWNKKWCYQILPQCLLFINFTSFEDLDNKFQVVQSDPLPIESFNMETYLAALPVFPIQTEYVGLAIYFKTIVNSIQDTILYNAVDNRGGE
ncbi:PIF-8 [Crangon crangon nudivirus]|uniref:PIF-8 n=1 Tax=Crangon crangon nudivirus TaxID=2880838 RepID=A0AAE8XZY4_9VIRU|nr:PIF-8 [Crangon crangon nudivirus]UBZ25489.1 PIF-8 [Crangon crangon nudivirus]